MVGVDIPGISSLLKSLFVQAVTGLPLRAFSSRWCCSLSALGAPRCQIVLEKHSWSNMQMSVPHHAYPEHRSADFFGLSTVARIVGSKGLRQSKETWTLPHFGD